MDKEIAESSRSKIVLDIEKRDKLIYGLADSPPLHITVICGLQVSMRLIKHIILKCLYLVSIFIWRLTHISLSSFLWDIGKQSKTRSDDAKKRRLIRFSTICLQNILSKFE